VLQSTEALKEKIALVDVLIIESIDPLLMGFTDDSAGLQA